MEHCAYGNHDMQDYGTATDTGPNKFDANAGRNRSSTVANVKVAYDKTANAAHATALWQHPASRDRQSVRARRLRARAGIITVAGTRCSTRRAVMVAVFAPESRGGINEIAVSDIAVHTNRWAG